MFCVDINECQALIGEGNKGISFTNDILSLFVGSQPKKHRLAQLVIMSPLGKLDLGNQHRFDPLAALHDDRCNPQAPPAFGFLGQVNEGTGGTSKFLQLCVDVRQKFLRKAAHNSAGEQKPSRTLVADEEGAKVSPAAFGWGVAADHKFLCSRQFDFDPGAAAPAGFVHRIRSLGDQPFELELPRYLQELFSGAPGLLGEADIGWCFSKRKNAFSHRLKDKLKQPPEMEPEMTADEMKVAEKALETAEKACYEASKWLLNLSISIRDPSEEQAEIFRERVRGLRDEVENMRSMFLH